MRKLIIFLFATTACGAPLPSFDVHASSKTTLPHQSCPTCALGAALPALSGPFGALGNFDLSQTQDFKNQGVPKDHITSVKLSALTLTASPTDGACSPADFSFLSGLEFHVAMSDGSQDQRLAHIEGANGAALSGTSLGLQVDDVELAPYVKSDTMKITTKATGHPPEHCDTDITGALTFHVKAHL